MWTEAIKQGWCIMSTGNAISFWSATFRNTEVESEFRQYYLKRDSNQGAFAVALFVLFYFCGGIFDYFFTQTHAMGTIVVNRLIVVTLGLIMINRITTCRSVSRCRMAPLLYVFFVLSAYLHVIVLSPLSEDGCVYPLILLATLTLIPVTFVQGVIVAVLQTALAVLAVGWFAVSNLHAMNTFAVLFNTALAGVIGTLGVYRFSISRRREFSNLMAEQHVVDILQKEVSERMEVEKELQRLASTDSLTGLWNRRKFMEVFEDEIARSCRYQRDLSLMVLDIDHFKRVNDQFGHSAGDDALIHFSKVCASCLRESDIMARMGGEEFAILLPETDEQGAMVLGERITEVVAASKLQHKKGEIKLTVSAGLCTMSEDTQPQRLYYRADMALYTAKENGRNRVEACPVSNFQIPESDLCRSIYTKGQYQ